MFYYGLRKDTSRSLCNIEKSIIITLYFANKFSLAVQEQVPVACKMCIYTVYSKCFEKNISSKKKKSFLRTVNFLLSEWRSKRDNGMSWPMRTVRLTGDESNVLS